MRVTSQPAPTTGSAGAKTFVTATMLTFTGGMLVLIGYIMVGGFGIFLGLVGAVFGVLWWKDLHDGVVPAQLPTKSVALLTLTGLALFGLAAAMA